MAKKTTTEKKETSTSIGALTKTRLTQRDRNLALKADLIDKGEHPEPSEEKMGSTKEKNLFLKNQLKENVKETAKENVKEKGKESTKESAKD